MRNRNPHPWRWIISTGLIILLFCGALFASGDGGGSGGHHNPFARVFEAFFIILLLALVGRYLANKTKQSAVLGELLMGIIAGGLLYMQDNPIITIIRNFDIIEEVGRLVTQKEYSYITAVDDILAESTLKPDVQTKLRELFIRPDLEEFLIISNSINFISSLGVILLLFMVGLEISISDMKKSGKNSIIVAILGIILPFAMGYGCTLILLPDLSHSSHVFIAATLCATSIGITARVFKDLGKIQIPEAKVVLGAAVIDDVLGLIILAVVTGMVSSGNVQISDILIILIKAVVFFGLLLWFGSALLKRSVQLFAKFDRSHVKLIYPFALLMICSYLADLIGLATIVGAFAAGLIIREEAFQLKGIKGFQNNETVEHILAPLEGVFAPVFFVVMGLQVDTSILFTKEVLVTGGVLTLVAILGKWLASVTMPKRLNKHIIGIGMVPRGEVGLIFAGIGRGLGVLDNELFAAVILVVLLTTLVTPPALSKMLRSYESKEPLKDQ